MSEQSEVIDVTKISSQRRSLLRTVDQMLDLTKISNQGESWRRTLKQFSMVRGMSLFFDFLR